MALPTGGDKTFVFKVRDGGGQVVNVKAHGATGDGTTNDRAAFVAAEAAGDYCFVPAGTYSIATSVTLSKVWTFAKGAIIKPASGATITFSGTVEAAPWRIFDLSAGGVVAFSRTATPDGIRPEWRGGRNDNTDAATTTTAMQWALDSAYSSESGLVRLIAGGKYAINGDSITHPTDVTVLGGNISQFRGTQIIHSGAGLVCWNMDAAGEYQMSRIEKVCFRGGVSGGTGIRCERPACQVVDVVFQDYTGNKLIDMTGTGGDAPYWSILENITNNGGTFNYGIYCAGDTNGVDIRHPRLSAAATATIFIADGDNINVLGGTVENGVIGIDVRGGKGISIRDVYFEANTIRDIRVVGSIEAVSGCVIDNCTHASNGTSTVAVEVRKVGALDCTGVVIQSGQYQGTYSTADVALTDAPTGVVFVNSGHRTLYANVGGTDYLELNANRVKMRGVGIIGSQAPANADTSGATLTELEAEVNELKQVLRNHGLIAT